MKKLNVEILEVENGYVIKDFNGKKWVAHKPASLGMLIEKMALEIKEEAKNVQKNN